MQILRENYPTHPIFKIDDEYLKYWENNNINCTYWDKTEILPILFTIRNIMYTNFHKLNQLWLNPNLINTSENEFDVSYYIIRVIPCEK